MLSSLKSGLGLKVASVRDFAARYLQDHMNHKIGPDILCDQNPNMLYGP